jgi:hypothetical protein
LKYSRLAAVFVVIMFVLAFLPVQQVTAAQGYTEKLTGYVAGSDALWYMNFGGINASAKGIESAEGVFGVNWYNLTILETSGWSTYSQVFGPNGYNLIPVPFVPNQGAFLTVGAGSYDEASSMAGYMGSYLLTTFVSYSNTSGTYTFYAPISFSSIAPSTLLTLVPSGVGGFASVIEASAFASLQSPIVTLQGVRGTSGSFAHSLTLGSVVVGALDSSYRPNFLKYFGTTNRYLRASNKSSSSTIDFHFLDGVINSTDKSALSGNSGGSGSYSLSLSPGEKVFALNATDAQTPAILLVQRTVDNGVLKPNSNVSVTISFTNPAGSEAVKTASLKDDWWESYPFFQLAKGYNSTIATQSLAAGASSRPTYVLKYTGNVTRQLTIPSLTVTYSYVVGAAKFYGRAETNPVTLSLGADEPVVYAYAVPGTSTVTAVGSTGYVNITARNVGTLTANHLVVAGRQEGGLPPDSSVAVSVPVIATALQETNFSKSYEVSYSTSGNQFFSISTNSLEAVFSHSSMKVGFPALSTSAYVSKLKSGVINLTVAFTLSNEGLVAVTDFNALGSLPAGLGCGTVKGSGLKCSSEQLNMTVPDIGTSTTLHASIEFNLSAGANYFFAPLMFHAVTAGLNFTGASNAVAAPSGLVVTKRFSPSVLFQGMSSVVAASVVNSGPFYAYNVTIQSYADSFDRLAASSALPIMFEQSLAPGSNLTAPYDVVASPVTSYGNLTSSSVVLKAYFGGTVYTLNEAGPTVGVYRPITVSILTSPASPVEGNSFSIGVTIQNPSPVSVSDVRYSLLIPSALTLSNLHGATFSGGNLTVSVSSLGPHESYTANATAEGTSGITVLFRSGSLTFAYSGVKLSGTVPNKDIVVGENALTRYTLPTIIVLLGILATTLYLRRKTAPISRASRQ